MNDEQTAAPVILDAHGQPARKATSTDCPNCRAKRDKRVRSSGFGQPHDVCGKCGHDFEEYTLG